MELLPNEGEIDQVDIEMLSNHSFGDDDVNIYRSSEDSDVSDNDSSSPVITEASETDSFSSDNYDIIEDFNDYNSDVFEQLHQDGNNRDEFNPNAGKYNELFNEHINCTILEVMTMIFSFFMRYNLPWNALIDLARMFNKIIGHAAIPASKHIFKRLFVHTACKSTKHYWCESCNLYMGVLQGTTVCDVCGSEVKTKYKKNYFISLEVEQQLKNCIEDNLRHNNMVFDHNIHSEIISDVMHGTVYNRIRESQNNQMFLTLTANTDGANVFKSTKNGSLWPIQFHINEINLQHRFKRKNLVCAAFTFGKPDMSTFLKPFIDELNSINDRGGIEIMTDQGLRKVTIFLLHFTMDSVAKAAVQNQKQFNGRHGCPYCLHEGDIVMGNQIRYCIHEGAQPPERNNNQSRTAMQRAYDTNSTVLGYFGPSPLIALEYFDVVWQMVLDYMHNLDLGVTKKIFDLWLNTKNHSKE